MEIPDLSGLYLYKSSICLEQAIRDEGPDRLRSHTIICGILRLAFRMRFLMDCLSFAVATVRCRYERERSDAA